MAARSDDNNKMRGTLGGRFTEKNDDGKQKSSDDYRNGGRQRCGVDDFALPAFPRPFFLLSSLLLLLLRGDGVVSLRLEAADTFS